MHEAHSSSLVIDEHKQMWLTLFSDWDGLVFSATGDCIWHYARILVKDKDMILLSVGLVLVAFRLSISVFV